jgi:hypothetical protein
MAAYEFLYQEDIYSITDSILIVLDKPWKEVSEEERVLLSKILGSVKLSLDKVQLVHAADTTLDSLKVYQPSKIISFGVTLSGAHELYKHHVSGNTSFILAESLHKLDDVSKKSLWMALKHAFYSKF